MINIAKELPKIFKFVEDHKTAFGILAGGIVAGKGISAGVGLFKGVKGVLGAFGIGGGGGIGKDLAGALGSKPIPVYVVNAPSGVPGGPGGVLGGAKGLLAKAGLVAAAGAAGYGIGTLIDRKTGASTAIANALDRKSAALEAAGVSSNQAALVKHASTRNAFVQQLEAAGLNHGQAVFVAEHGGQGAGFAIPAAAQRLLQQGSNIQVTPTINIQIDGRTLATVTAPHIIEHVGRRLQTETANGAAPRSRTP